MLTQESSEFITLEFEPRDNIHTVDKFINDLTLLIPDIERIDSAFGLFWHIKATPENQRHVRALKDLYFPEDPNKE